MLSFVFSKCPALGSLYNGTEHRQRIMFTAIDRIMTHLPSEDASIKPQITRDINKLHICGHFLTQGNLDKVAGDERSSRKGRLRAITEDDDVSGEHVMYGRYGTRGRKVLPRVKGRLKDDNNNEDDSEGKVGRLRIWVSQRLPTGANSLFLSEFNWFWRGGER
jgi:hypothetical protein